MNINLSTEKTIETQNQYIQRAEWLLSRLAKEQSIDKDKINGVLLAQFIINMRFSLAKATFRTYKASVIFYLNYRHFSDSEEAIKLLKEYTQEDCLKNTRRTGNLRKKQITDEQFISVVYAVSIQNHEYAKLTSLWLKAGSYTGLRPHEWETAKIVVIGETLFLQVKNAKNTNGRSHGEYRHIDLSLLSESELGDIETFIDLFQKECQEFGYKFVYSQCQYLLQATNKKLVKGLMKHKDFDNRVGSGIFRRYNSEKEPILRIQLYSARHFFSSRAKQYLSMEEVAAIMGHKTDLTATVHYGRKERDYARSKVKPSPKETAKVQIKNPRNVKYVKPTVPSKTTITPTHQIKFKP